jgi:YD repeat-containing protein
MMKRYNGSESILQKALLTVGILSVTASFALTSGPAMPEYNDFEPVDATDMVNLATGDFSYNIPVMTVPGPGLGFPIVLDYHAGITPKQEASWVGLGWNLQAGAITRQVHGVPDDYQGDPIKEEIKSDKISGWMVSISYNIATVGISCDNTNGYGGMVGISFAPKESMVGLGVEVGFNGAYEGASGFHLTAGSTSKGWEGLSASASASIGVSAGGGLEAGAGGGLGYAHDLGTGSNARTTTASLLSLGVDLSSNSGLGFRGRGAGSFSSSTSINGINRHSSSSIILPGYFPGVGFFAVSWGSWSTWIENQQTTRNYGFLYSDKYGMNCDASSTPDYCSDNTLGDYLGKKQEYEQFTLPWNPNSWSNDDNVSHARMSATTEDLYMVGTQGLSGAFSPHRQEDGDYLTALEGTSKFIPFAGRHSINRTRRLEDGRNHLNQLNRGQYDIYWRFSDDAAGSQITDNAINTFSESSRDKGAEFSYQSKKIEPRIVNGKIVGFTITKPDGVQYRYFFPLTNVWQRQNAYRQDEREISTEQNLSSPYAYAWLLTDIRSPDYVDLDNSNTVSEKDIGGWIKFTYGNGDLSNGEGKTLLYHWRSPYFDSDFDMSPYSGTKGREFLTYAPNTLGETRVFNENEDKESYENSERTSNLFLTGRNAVEGVKTVAYLQKVESPTHVAEFHMSDRDDSKPFKEQNFMLIRHDAYKDLFLHVSPLPLGFEKISIQIKFTALIKDLGLDGVLQEGDVVDVQILWNKLTHTEYRDANHSENTVESGDESVISETVTVQKDQSNNLFMTTTLVSRPTGWLFVGETTYEDIPETFDVKIRYTGKMATRLKKLDYIVLKNKTGDVPVTTSAVKFKYDYSLTPMTPNSDAPNHAKLTLGSVLIGTGENGPWMNPYTFQYQSASEPFDPNQRLLKKPADASFDVNQNAGRSFIKPASKEVWIRIPSDLESQSEVFGSYEIMFEEHFGNISTHFTLGAYNLPLNRTMLDGKLWGVRNYEIDIPLQGRIVQAEGGNVLGIGTKGFAPFEGNIWDRWGNRCVSCSEARTNPVGNEAVAWNLEKITMPSGGEIRVEYEADKFKYLLNESGATEFYENGTSEMPLQPGERKVLLTRGYGRNIGNELKVELKNANLALSGAVPKKYFLKLRASSLIGRLDGLGQGANHSDPVQFITWQNPNSTLTDGQVAIKTLAHNSPSPLEEYTFKFVLAFGSGFVQSMTINDYEIWAVIDQPADLEVVGGGIRVKKVTLADPFSNTLNETSYEYADGATPSLPPTFSDYLDQRYKPGRGMESYIGTSGVTYGTVQVKFGGNNGYTRYRFITPRDLPVVMMPSELLQQKMVPVGLSSYPQKLFRISIADFSALWGASYSQEQVDAEGNVVKSEKTKWAFNADYAKKILKNATGLPSKQPMGVEPSEILTNHPVPGERAKMYYPFASSTEGFGVHQGIHSNRYFWTSCFVSNHCDQEFPQKIAVTQVVNSTLLPVPFEKSETQDGISSSSYTYGWDFATGEPLKSMAKNTDGQVLIKETVPAYSMYHFMAVKNELTQSYATINYAYPPNQAGFNSTENPANVVSASITKWRPYRREDGRVPDAGTEVLEQNVQAFRVYENMDWINKADGVTRAFSLPDETSTVFHSCTEAVDVCGPYRFSINNAAASDWRSTGKNVGYDGFGHVVDFTAANGTPTSQLFGYGNALPTAFVQNGTSQSIFYESFENAKDVVKRLLNPGAPGCVSSDESLCGYPNARLSTSSTKTGNKALKVPNTPHTLVCFTIPEMKANQGYKASVWYFDATSGLSSSDPLATRPGIFIGQDGGCASQEHPNGTGGSGPPQTLAQNPAVAVGSHTWKRIEAEIKPGQCPDPAGLAHPIVCLYASAGNVGSSVFYDELRVRPSEAFMTTYAYDAKGNMISSADLNEVTSRFEYDAFGNLKAIRNDDGVILSEKTKQLGKR